MKIKRFHGRTMRDALQQVREEQGPDSVILSKRKLADGIEVIAAVDYDEALLHQSNLMLRESRQVQAVAETDPAERRTLSGTESVRGQAEPATAGKAIGNLFARAYANSQAATGDPDPQDGDDASGIANGQREPSGEDRAGERPASELPAGRQPSDFQSIFDAAATIATLQEPGAQTSSAGESGSGSGTLDQIAAQLQTLQTTLDRRFTELHWDELQRQEPQLAEVIRRLNLLGLESNLVRDIVSALSPDRTERNAPLADQKKAWRNAIGLLAKRIPIARQDICDEGGVFAIVGPTGAGKTTSIAKLAARFALEHGPDELGLITTDGYRIGAQEHLLRFGKVLGVPVQVAGGPEILRTTLDQLADKKLILIDTAGFSLKDEAMFHDLADLIRHSPTIQTLLTLPANMQTAGLKQAIRVFDPLGLDGVIVTKVDEATSLGGLLSAVIESDLAVSYVADGQRVPEDIRTASRYRAEFVSQAVSLAREFAADTDGHEVMVPVQHSAGSTDRMPTPLTTSRKRIASYG